MLKTFVRLAIVAGAIALSSAPGSAQPVSQQNCKAEIAETGSAALTEAGAKDKARTQWRRTAISKFGDFFGGWEQARGTSERCTKTLLGLTRCEARAQPCEVAGSGGTSATEIACNKARDSKNCEPIVKWVQIRLNAKLGTNLVTDGSAGKSTVEVLRRFQRQNNLGSSGDIDEKTLAALR